MSLPDRLSARRFRHAGIAALLAAMALASACTVRPLYSDTSIETGAVPGAAAGFKQISIDAVDTRYGQQLRNDLIFLLNGGAGQPAQAKYKMTLAASILVLDEAEVEVDNDTRPTAATLHMTGSYVLIDLSTGKPVAKGSRTIPASYDQPTQEFANLRARRDAEDRAARELAELLRLDIGQKLAKLPAA
ncbi:LPS assembly lipoprotein LptE [Mesorhizobium yinganensis]|uniref:LPS assembly lipoprotein LptE n=1 Tax=Mesorhizobium yinganensis TaxID=3157707 RepID=UPI0032B79FEC